VTRFQTSWRESLSITVCAVILGFSYTFVQEKGLFAGPASARTASGQVSAAPQIIEIQEALNLYQSGNAVFVDARHEFDYKLGHIKGAVSLPLAEFAAKSEIVSSLPRNRPIVTYCDGAECSSSVELATLLMESGFTSVKVFFAGWNEWRNQGLPTAVKE